MMRRRLEDSTSTTRSSVTKCSFLPKLTKPKNLSFRCQPDDEFPLITRKEGNFVLRANNTSRRQFQIIDAREIDYAQQAKDRRLLDRLQEKSSGSESESVIQEEQDHQTMLKEQFFNLYKGKPKKSRASQYQITSLKFMVDMSKSKGLIPRTFGVLGDSDSLNLGGKKIGLDYSQVVSQVMLNRKCTKLDLSDNRLDDSAVLTFIAKADDSLEQLQVARNKLSGTIAQEIASKIGDKLKNIEVLNLEQVGFRQKDALILMQGIEKAESRIKSLNLGRNHIGKGGVEAISHLLKNSSIEVLSLQWNEIFVDSGIQLFSALRGKSRLKVLDLSFNNLGGGDPPFLCTQALRKMLTQNSQLLHLDLAGNRFTRQQLRMIKDGLAQNNVLMGLHVEHQACYTNPRGFLELADCHTIKHHPIQGIQVIKYKKLAQEPHQLQDVCWICDGWQQFYFILPIDKKVWIHFHFQDFKPRFMGFPVRGNIEYLTLLPPGRVLFFFTVEDRVTLLDCYKRIELRVDRHIEIEPQHLKLMVHANLTEVHRLKITPVQESILSSNFSVLTDYVPRKEPQFKAESVASGWDFKHSIFARFYSLQDKLPACFQLDWSMSKINKLEKNPIQLQELKSVLRQAYPRIFHIYRNLSAQTPILSTYCVQIIRFGQFCEEIGLLSRDFQLKHADILFMATKGASSDFKHEHCPERGLIRYQFMQAIVRLAKQKYGRGRTLAQALRNLIAVNLNQIAQNSLTEWRKTKLFTQEMDVVIKSKRNKLQQVFQRYSVRKVLPGRKKFMCFEEFCEVLLWVCPDMGQRSLCIRFNAGMAVQVDEIYSRRFFQMTFMEFIEAFARCIDFYDKEDLPLADRFARAIDSLPSFQPDDDHETD